MTERGLPIVDGAPACPFVAFDDDRDERATSPDHRHRCYAEPEPAPRALAHQEAYCLSSAFPVCPTFQDWARREAARSRGEQPRTDDSIAALAAAPVPQRNPPRNWAAPPPWASRGDASRGQEQLWDSEAEGADEVVTADPALPRRGQGLSGSFADRVASGPGGAAPGPGAGQMPGSREPDEPEAPPQPPPSPLAPASAMAPGPAMAPASAMAAASAMAHPPSGGRDEDPDDWDDEEPDGGRGQRSEYDEAAGTGAPEPPVRRRRERDVGPMGALSGGRGGGDRGGGRGPGGGGGGGEPRPRRDARAPEWERARPLEAYPTLRSRRLSELSVPPLLVGVVALALAAAVLFALPGLLGFGDPSTGGSPSPTTPIVTPLVTPAPTPVPQPTDQIYIVQQGDTMSRIAGKFDIPIGDLIAANAENIPDPNKLQIGDQVIIPARDPEELPAASEIPGAT